MVGESTSTQVLRDMEISLRTNHIEWVKEFLDDTNQGLDALVDYLSFRLQMMRHEQRVEVTLTESEERLNVNNTTSARKSNDCDENTHKISITNSNLLTDSSSSSSRYHQNSNPSPLNTIANGFLRPSLTEVLDSPNIKRRSRHIAKLNMGASTDDIHVCIMCLRAIMNNKYGFNMVIQHREAINCIALSLIHKSLRTKALVLELLAAICLVKGGHEIILSAFDNFKNICQENRRFHTLMEYFKHHEAFNIDFLVACVQFMNIVVHSVEDMNYRVHLQYEFTALGLDNYLEKLRLTESEELKVQISAYLDNVFDVAALMEDSETKTAALERVQELEDQVEREIDRNSELLYKLSEMEREVDFLKTEREDLLTTKLKFDEEVTTLRRILKQNEQELKKRDSLLQSKNLELQSLTRSLPHSISSNDGLMSNSDAAQIQQPQNDISSLLPPPPPPPLPKPGICNGMESTPPPPPPPPMQLNANHSLPPLPPPLLGKSASLTMQNGPPPPPPPAPNNIHMMRSLPQTNNYHLAFQPPPPPVAGFMPAPDGAMTIKRKVPTKYKLPTLNWIALKPNQVND